MGASLPMLYRKLSSRIHLMSGLISAIAVFALLTSATAFANDGPYRLEVYKSSRELIVKEGDQIIKRYHIAIGRGSDGTKRKLGDHKTPIGMYKIVEFKENSQFHFFMLINYPNQLDAWHGYIDNLIDAKQFKEIVAADWNNELPPQDTVLGGYIGLHGIGEVTEEKLSMHNQQNWTQGCIALTNEEISELRNYVAVGTTIEIKE